MAALLETPLNGTHVALGATLTDFAGWAMPLRYSSDREEHEAVRQRAGIFDLSHMAQIEVEGPLAAECLDASLVTMPSQMPIGRARYSLIVDRDGGILDDIIVYRLDNALFLVVANAANRLVVRDELTARAAAHCEAEGKELQVSVTDTTMHRAMIAVQGPRSRDIVTGMLPQYAAQIEELGYYRLLEIDDDGVPIRLARTGYTGEIGYELMIPAAAAEALWERALDEGESEGLIPCGLAARDSLRLEAGMPLYGHELSRETAPVDAGLGRVVKEHRFVGGEALAKREQRWELYGLAGEGRRAARAGCAVLRDGEEIGTVTSGMLSLTLGYPIALVRAVPGLAPGEQIAVDVRGKLLPMSVVELPFYKRPV
ncbi:MAG: glycine cleavage system aminomethyltransferase GcvT [Ancrocorticia sp.]